MFYIVNLHDHVFPTPQTYTIWKIFEFFTLTNYRFDILECKTLAFKSSYLIIINWVCSKWKKEPNYRK